MPAEVVIPPDSEISRALHRAARDCRCVFFAGLPGVGKSLMLQQQALIAHGAGRVVHLLQWDVTRGAFETPELLARYPEVDGVTHAAIRKAVGLWVRDAVRRWHEAHPAPEHLLIGEAPLVGNRLVELAQVHDDPVEPLLAGERTLFFIPAPSNEVRRLIERSRAREMEAPLHEREAANAAPSVVQALWRDIQQVAAFLGASSAASDEYDSALYVDVYSRLLRHRRKQSLHIRSVLPVSSSPYDLDVAASELRADPSDVERITSKLATYPAAQLEAQVEGWYRL